MRGFKNFKGSDARCPSIHFLFYAPDTTILQIVQEDKIEFLGEPPTQYACPSNSIARKHAPKLTRQ